MADCVPFWMPGNEVTVHAEAALTGCRLAAISGNPVNGNPLVNKPAAGAACHFLIARDVAAAGKVLAFKGNQVCPVEVGAGGITAGDDLECDAEGRVITLAAGVKVGVAYADAAAAALGQVALDL